MLSLIYVKNIKDRRRFILKKVIDFLSALDFFQGLKKEDLEDIANITVIKKFGRGELLFSEGDMGKKEPAIDLKTKLILSLSNAVGAGRLRQATRELVKAYSIGLTVEEMDEMFTLFAWNGGIGTFSSEIGPSQLFEVYQTIKNMEGSGKNRVDITGILIEKFGEKNPSTGVINR